jgi:hypothetical protein
MTMGGMSAGSRASTDRIASVPPVEAPMATTWPVSNRDDKPLADGVGIGTASARMSGKLIYVR